MGKKSVYWAFPVPLSAPDKSIPSQDPLNSLRSYAYMISTWPRKAMCRKSYASDMGVNI